MHRRQSLIIALVVIVVLGLVGWNYVLGTPQYSVYQMYQAVKKHDYAKFEEYVDVDSISTDLVNREVTKTQNLNPLRGTSLWINLGQSFAQNLITTMKPTLITAVKGGIKKGVETGTIGTALPKIANLYQALTQVKAKQNGDVEDVTIMDKSKTLHVTMKQVDNHWQVTKMDLDPQSLPTQH